MNKRQELKRALVDNPLRKVIIDGRVFSCEGQAFVDHVCSGGLEMNEVFITKGRVQKMSARDRDYINDEINCSIVCSAFHAEHGHSREFRRFFILQQKERYGTDRVKNYLINSPLKIANDLLEDTVP